MNGLDEIMMRFALATAHMLWVGALLWLIVFLAERVFARTPEVGHRVHLFGMGAMLVAFPLCFVFSEPSDTQSAPREAPVAATTSEDAGVKVVSGAESVVLSGDSSPPNVAEIPQDVASASPVAGMVVEETRTGRGECEAAVRLRPGRCGARGTCGSHKRLTPHAILVIHRDGQRKRVAGLPQSGASGDRRALRELPGSRRRPLLG